MSETEKGQCAYCNFYFEKGISERSCTLANIRSELVEGEWQEVGKCEFLSGRTTEPKKDDRKNE